MTYPALYIFRIVCSSLILAAFALYLYSPAVFKRIRPEIVGDSPQGRRVVGVQPGGNQAGDRRALSVGSIDTHRESDISSSLVGRKIDHQSMSSILSSMRGVEMRQRFGSFYRELNLSREKSNQLEEALSGIWIDVASADTLLSKDPLTDGEKIILDSCVARINKTVSGVIGAENLDKFNQHMRLKEVSDLVGESSAILTMGGQPLTVPQADLLFEMLRDQVVNTARGEEITAASLRGIDENTIAQNLSSFYTPQQIEIVHLVLKKWRFDQTYREATGTSERPRIRGL